MNFFFSFFFSIPVNIFRLGRRQDIFFSSPLYFFPYSFFSSYLLPLFLCLISILMFPCPSVRENTRAWVELSSQFSMPYSMRHALIALQQWKHWNRSAGKLNSNLTNLLYYLLPSYDSWQRITYCITYCRHTTHDSVLPIVLPTRHMTYDCILPIVLPTAIIWHMTACYLLYYLLSSYDIWLHITYCITYCRHTAFDWIFIKGMDASK